MSASTSFTWTGTQSGDWATPANWADVTSGQTVSSVAPGPLDIAMVSGATLTGSGAAADLTFLGDNAVLGDLNVGVVSVLGSGNAIVNVATLDIAAGATVHAGTAQIGNLTGGVLAAGAEIVVNGADATFDLTGSLQFSGEAFSEGLTAANGGTAQVGGLTVTGSLVSCNISADARSILEIGTAGTAAPGHVTIDQGYTASGPIDINGNIIDNGLIVGSAVSLGTPWSPSLLAGTGTIEVLAGGTLTVGAVVAGAGLTFQADGAANLILDADIAGGNTINLQGNGNTLTFGDNFYITVPPVVPETVHATINGFDNSDAIVYNTGTITGTNFIPGTGAGPGTLELLDGSRSVLDLTLAGDYSGRSFVVTPVSSVQEKITVACFAAGTRIATPGGEVAVERLQAGEAVLTASGQAQPIAWIGRRRLHCRLHAEPERVKPVRIAPHAFGEDRPTRPLLLSPDHSVFVDDVLIPVKFLINGATIVQIDAETVTYYHLELPRHDVVLANGVPAETYLETGGRSAFENGGGAMQLHPDLAADERRVGMVWRNFACAPLIGSETILHRVRCRLAWQALMLGYQADGTPPRPAHDGNSARPPKALSG